MKINLRIAVLLMFLVVTMSVSTIILMDIILSEERQKHQENLRQTYILGYMRGWNNSLPYFPDEIIMSDLGNYRQQLTLAHEWSLRDLPDSTLITHTEKP